MLETDFAADGPNRNKNHLCRLEKNTHKHSQNRRASHSANIEAVPMINIFFPAVLKGR